MRVTKEFQPIVLKVCDPKDDCQCGSVSCNQLALLDDKFSFQLQNDVNFLQSDLIVNGDFANVVGGGSVSGGEVANWSSFNPGGANDWNASTNQACVQGNPQSQVMYQAVAIAECKCYRHIFDLKTDLPDGCTLTIYLDDGTDTWTEVVNSYTNMSAQDDIVDVFCADQAWSKIGYQITGGDDCEETSFCIDNIELRMYDITINIYDCCNDTLVDTIDDCDIKFNEEYVLIQGLWSDYVSSKSCYKFCLDNFELVSNGDFATGDLTDWTQTGTGNSWAVAGGVAGGSISFGGELKILTQTFEDPLLFTCDIELTFEIASITRGDNTADLDVYINGEKKQTFSTITTHTYTLPKDQQIESIGFKATDTSNLANAIEIDNISIEVDLCSDCICVAESHPYCTNLLTSKHSENTTDFEFEFDTDFKFYLRLWSRIINPRYPTEEELYLSSGGVSTLNFSRNEKLWEFQIERVPEYVWDAIQRMFSFDELTIAGVRYVKIIGDIEPEWRRSNTKLAAGSIEIKKGTDNRIAN